ncbi:hypothetical protein OJF2_70950 [Aquisphaera giovannonii]|uniref:PSP1 C-terminal domain-containing protein n=1 Tax=Aquisphaera giovannonii TaxID=406548 RepID=A0A5B9WD46_9BACT|nr:hypothetical protein [Aquisphaera giovannonii]QEH38492.1 hypothetical protein OJF2_70950 [Aquisphaera giovannonii]
MGEGPGCLVRYGLTGHVGRFPVDPSSGLGAARGQAVVVRTDRGLELGEVLVPSAAGAEAPGDGSHRVLRAAGPDDLAAARRGESLRAERFAACREVLDGAGPGLDLELLDVEPLLDPETTVLHVLGVAAGDLALLRARFRSLMDIDVVFESCGADPLAAPAPPPSSSRGGCGDCDCGAGGCGSSRKAEPGPAASCGTATAHAGCASCGLHRR